MLITADRIVVGGTQAPANDFLFCGNLTAATTNAVGGVLKLQNPLSVDLLITDFILNITTASTGAATVDCGVDDDGAQSNDTLIDGLDVNAAAGVFDNHVDVGTKGGMAIWAAGEYVVITASASLAGLVGTYKIKALAE